MITKSPIASADNGMEFVTVSESKTVGERMSREIGALLSEYRGNAEQVMTGTVTIHVNAATGESGEGFKTEIPFKIDPATLTAVRQVMNPSSSKIDVEQPKPGLFILRLSGSFIGTDETDVHQLAQTMIGTIEMTEKPRVIVNCNEMKQLASDGIVPPLLALWEKVQQKKGKLSLCGVPDDLNELLAITHLNRVMTVSSTEEDATKQ